MLKLGFNFLVVVLLALVVVFVWRGKRREKWERAGLCYSCGAVPQPPSEKPGAGAGAAPKPPKVKPGAGAGAGAPKLPNEKAGVAAAAGGGVGRVGGECVLGATQSVETGPRREVTGTHRVRQS